MSRVPSLLESKLLGVLPPEWEYVRFSQLYSQPIRDFGSFSTTKLITFIKEGVPFIKSEMIKAGAIDWATTQYISNDVHEKLNKSYVLPGNILFSKIGSALGKAVVYEGEKGVCNSNAAVAKISLNDNKSNKYFFTLLLNSNIAKRQFHRLIISLLPRINLGDINNLILPLPPVEEQAKIAQILSTWDQAIETTEKLIENSKAQKKSLMQQLLTGKKRLPGFSGEWQEYRFKQIFDRLKRKNTVGNDNVLTISGKDGLISQKEYFNKRVASENLEGYTLLHRGDFAYNKSYSNGYPYGAIKPLDRYDAGVVSSLYICFFLINPVDHNHDFFRHYFEGGYFDREIYAIAQEGARNHGLLNVSSTDFLITRLRIPSLNEQTAIAEVIDTAEEEQHNFEQQLQSLQLQKKALMQQLLTGKRRVKV